MQALTWKGSCLTLKILSVKETLLVLFPCQLQSQVLHNARTPTVPLRKTSDAWLLVRPHKQSLPGSKLQLRAEPPVVFIWRCTAGCAWPIPMHWLGTWTFPSCQKPFWGREEDLSTWNRAQIMPQTSPTHHSVAKPPRLGACLPHNAGVAAAVRKGLLQRAGGTGSRDATSETSSPATHVYEENGISF